MMAQLARWSYHGVAVVFVAFVALVGIIACTLLGVPVPEILELVLVSALGAQFGLAVPGKSNPADHDR